jgi:hypothetical protein
MVAHAYAENVFHKIGLIATITTGAGVQNGASFDSILGRANCAVVAVGTSGDGAGVDITFKLQESDDQSTWSDVANPADTTTYLPDVQWYNQTNEEVIDTVDLTVDAADEDDSIYLAEYKGDMRYFRVVATPAAGNTNGTPVAIVQGTTALNVQPNIVPIGDNA